MQKENSSIRERLLSRLPQPENLPAYREETASLLARHEKALFWEKWTAVPIVWLGLALWMLTNSTWGLSLNINERLAFNSFAVILVISGGLNSLKYWVNRSKVDLLKEVKQVQLQLLEFQASLKNDGDHRP
jgi:hypothetical protein